VYETKKDMYYLKSNLSCVVSAFIFHKFLFNETSLHYFKYGKIAMGYAAGAILYEGYHRIFEK
jgi:hypothetical protein